MLVYQLYGVSIYTVFSISKASFDENVTTLSARKYGLFDIRTMSYSSPLIYHR